MEDGVDLRQYIHLMWSRRYLLGSVTLIAVIASVLSSWSSPRLYSRALGRVTLSLGVAVFPEHGNTTDALIRAADAALYRAKQRGRARVEVA